MTTTLTPPLTTTVADLPTIPVGYGRMLNSVTDEARVLERTADLLITGGWCQGRSRDDSGRRCMTFAVGSAVAQLFSHYSETTAHAIYVDTCALIAEVLRERERYFDLPEMWNDKATNNLDSVLDVVAAARVAAS